MLHMHTKLAFFYILPIAMRRKAMPMSNSGLIKAVDLCYECKNVILYTLFILVARRSYFYFKYYIISKIETFGHKNNHFYKVKNNLALTKQPIKIPYT